MNPQLPILSVSRKSKQQKVEHDKQFMFMKQFIVCQ